MPKSTLPAHTKRAIYWNSEAVGAGCVLIGYCPDTLDFFLGMFELAKESFPDLRPGECTCGKVKKSRFIQGHTLLIFKVVGPKREIEGWESRGPVDFNY